MSVLTVTIIFLCLCVDNMVSANMSSMKLATDQRSVFSIKIALFFAGFNMLFLGVGYLLSMIFFPRWVHPVNNWVAFAFLLLLGIKLALEFVEKSPSFGTPDVNNTRKLISISSWIGLNALLVGYAMETMGTAFFPQFIFLGLLTFCITLIGFHLGGPTSQTIASKKIELAAGAVLIVIAICMILV